MSIKVGDDVIFAVTVADPDGSAWDGSNVPTGIALAGILRELADALERETQDYPPDMAGTWTRTRTVQAQGGYPDGFAGGRTEVTVRVTDQFFTGTAEAVAVD
jgi:hypothetical protein